VRQEILDSASRKRNAPMSGDAAATKRAKITDAVVELKEYPPLPATRPISYAELFTLTDDADSKSFDVTALSLDMVITILLPVFQSIDQRQMDHAISVSTQT